MRADLPVRKTLRLDGFDYASTGIYFVTICTDKRLSRFGRVVGDAMHLNRAGCIVNDEWLLTPAWQRGYRDHIIRNDADLQRVREYILTNRLRWTLDRYYREEISVASIRR